MSLHLRRANARLPIPLMSLTLTGAGAAYTRDAANQFSISLPTTVTTYRVEIPLAHQFPYFIEGGASTAAVGNLSGFLLRQILLWYSIGTADLSTHTITIATEAIAGNAARAAAVAYSGGTLTYNTDDGALTTMGLVQRANLYKTVVSLPIPFQLGTDLSRSNAEWTLVTGSSGTAKIHGVTLLGDFGLYA